MEIGERSASTSTAGSSPRSDRIAGWMPRASSRSSASASPSRVAAASASGPASWAPRGARRVVVAGGGGQKAQVERQRDELLLRAVVQVALELAAGVVGGLDDAQAR